jgi:hypothetical protein
MIAQPCPRSRAARAVLWQIGDNNMKNGALSEFEDLARENARTGIWGELWGFLSNNKKWWLLPIIVMLLVFGILIFLSATAAAPFIYTLF